MYIIYVPFLKTRYNAPTVSQVAAIWSDGNDPQRCFDRSVLVYARGGHPCYIKEYHGCYDPLAYPLFNPKGETGCNKFMSYNDTMTDREGHTSVDPTDVADPIGTENDLTSNALIKHMGTY